MEYLAYGLGALLFVSALGLGFTLLLLPGELRHYSLIVAPWVGYCYGTLACWEVYMFGGRTSAHTAQLILIPPILCLVVILFMKGFTPTLTTVFGSRKVIGTLLLAGAVFVFLSIPALGHKELTTVSLFNHDVPAYAIASRFFMDFTRTSSDGFVGQGSEFFNHYPMAWSFGSVSSAAFLAVYLGVMPDQDTTLCVNLFGALGAAALFLLLSDSLKIRTNVAFLGVALLGSHPAFQYLALEGFFAQIVGMGLAVMILWAHSKLVEPLGRPRHLTRYLILFTCFTSGLLLTYQHMLPFVWILAGVYSVVLALLQRAVRPIWISAVGYLVALAAFAVLCPARAIAFLEFFRYIAGVQAGWFMPFFSPDYLVGLSYQNSPFTIEDPHFHRIAAVAVGTIAFFWLLIAFRNARKTTIALWFGCAVIYIGVIILGFRGEDGQIGGYKSFKFATFFLPFFAAAVASLFDIVPNTWTRLSFIFRLLVLASLSFGYSRADGRLLKAMQTAEKWVQPQYRDLLSIDADSAVETVNILGADGWGSMWAAYFLMHKKLYMEHDTYFPQSLLEGTYDLQDNQINAPIRHLPSARVPGIRCVNDRFCLIGPIPKE